MTTHLPSLYLPYENGTQEHAFARRIREFSDTARKGSVLIVHAPTGAGKTKAVLPIAKQGNGVLITVPTNALAAEIVETYQKEFGPRVARWNADAFVTRGRRRHSDMMEQARLDDLVVSNPDLLHLFTQNEYVANYDRVRLAAQGMRTLRLLVFDEYHAYDERILASLLLYVMKSRAAKNNEQRFVFMSATKDDGLPIALRALGIEFSEAPTDEPTTMIMPPAAGRMIKGPIDLEVRTDSILASLPSKPSPDRTLYMFSTFSSQQRAVRTLLARGFELGDQPDGFVEITGRETRSRAGQQSWDRAGILLATSKVEVGLNIANLDAVVMEPGWSEQQFWQRFGRAARGRPAHVTLHFEGYDDPVVASIRAASDYDSITVAMRSVIDEDRKHIDTVLRFVGAYAASYHENTPPSADSRTIQRDDLPALARQAYGMVQSIFRKAEGDPAATEEGGAIEWRDTIRAALRGLRGRTLEVPAVYEWVPHKEVRESLIYVLSKTTYVRRIDGSYLVKEFRERPADTILTYEVLDHPIRLTTRGSIKRKDFRAVVSGGLRRIIARELGEPAPPFWDALAAWLAVVPPDEIPPREVTPDDIFL